MAGRDGFVFFSEAGRGVVAFFQGGTGRSFFFPKRDGAVVFFSEAGRRDCVFFPRRDGAVVFFFRGGTGRGGCVFSAPGSGGCIFCSRRDGRVFFSAGTGRLTVVVFSAGTVLFIRGAKRGGVTFCEKCHGGA